MNSQVITVILTIAGSMATTFLTLHFNQGKTQAETESLQIKSMKDLWDRIAHLEERVAHLENENQRLREENFSLKHSQEA